VAYNFRIGSNKTKLLMGYKVARKSVLFGNAVLAALMSGTKYDVIPQNGDSSKESNVRTLVFRKKVKTRTQCGKDSPSDNDVRRWLKQFQEAGSVLHRNGVGRLSTSQEAVGRVQEGFLEVHRNQLDEYLQLGRP
jgi:hypothetical protein